MSEKHRLCSLLWGLSWDTWLPTRLDGTGIDVATISFSNALTFIDAHYRAIFEEGEHTAFHLERFSDSKRRYYEHAGDFFGFFDRRELVGLLVATPHDWSTYYLRSGGLLPPYQRRGLMPKLFCLLFHHLRRVGVERVEAEASLSNMASVAMLNRLQFNASGTYVSERWGVLTRFTKFLSLPHEELFLQQFCSGVHHQNRTDEAICQAGERNTVLADSVTTTDEKGASP